MIRIFLLPGKFYLLFFLFYSTVLSQSEEITFERIDNDFLSQKYSTAVGQDSAGFIWLGTREGLFRYDGRNVKKYISNPEKTNSLSGNGVQKIFTDSKGNLWVASDGLHLYNYIKDNFIRIEPPVYDSLSLKLKFITAICEDKLGNLWLGTFGQGLYKLNPSTGEISYIKLGDKIPPPFRDYLINSIISDGSDQLLVTSNGHQITFINIHTNRQQYFYLGDKGDIQNLFVDRKGNYWLVEIGNPLKQIFIKGNKLNFKSFDKVQAENFFYPMQDDIKNNLWLGTQSEGLYIFNPGKNEIKNYRFNSRNNNSLPGDFIEDIFEDKAGNIWVATNKGVCKWSPWKKPFKHFSYDTEDPNSIPSSEVTGIDKDKDVNLWISTFNTGFCKLNLKTGKITRFNPSNSEIKSPWALEILAADDGNIWVATNFQHGLNYFNTKSGIFKEYLNDPEDEKSISSNIATVLYEDKQKRIWIGTAGKGLNLYNRDDDNFKRFISEPGKNNLSSNDIFSLYEDENSVLWIGTGEGLNKFNVQNNSFTSYLPPSFIGDTTNQFQVFSICEGSPEILWLGTASGLYKFNIKNNNFTSIPELSAFRISGVLKDNSGNLWLQTISSVIKFNPENNKFRIYDKNDGWIQTVVNEREWMNSYAKLTNGEMVFGGVNGVTIFNPYEVKDNDDIPSVYLTRFKLFNKEIDVNENYSESRNAEDSILTKSILFTEEIILNYNENSFTFEFASLDYTNPLSNKYSFLLEGFTEDWSIPSNSNSASFTNISPGEYVCKVRASNSDGVWNNRGAVIKLIINPPWWRTTTAYIIYGLIFLFLLYALRRFEINRIKTRNRLRMKEFETKKLQEVDQLKSGFFANISHEFRTPLTLIIGLIDKHLKKKDDNKNDFIVMKKNAQRTLQLINQLLDLSKLETGNVKIKIQKVDLLKFVERITSNFISLAEQRNLKLEFNNHPVLLKQEEEEIFIYLDKEKMETVIYNLISNALKFSPENEKVSINVSSTPDGALVSVTNTGVSIPQDEIPFIFDKFYQGKPVSNFEGTGIGLALAKEYIEMHHGWIKAESNDNETTFEIYLLKDKSHFSPEEIIDKEIPETEPVKYIEDISYDRKEAKKEIRNAESGMILIVEDHFDLRNFMCEQLEDEYSVIEAENGEKGLRLAKELIPDLIISDIMMPEMDGYKLCSEIKKNFRTNHIPVILLTAKAALENKIEGLEAGADDYLIKPFNTDELKARVKNLINIRKQLQEKYRSEMILKPAKVIVPSNQKVFIEKLTGIIEKNISDENFNVEILSKEIGMSRSQLHRKMKALTNQSPSEFLRVFRLKRAADLIKQDAGNIAEISYKVGFNSQAYFTKLFQEMYGCTPKDFRKQTGKPEDKSEIVS